MVLCLPLIGQQNKPETAETKAKATDKGANSQPVTAATEIRGSSPAVQHAPNHKQQTAEAESKPFLTHGEWVMGILTAVYLGISFFGLKAIIKQARIAQHAANAAKASADALINAERAWVIAELVPICVKFGKSWHRPAGSGWAALSEEEILKGDHLKHKLKLTNMGRTPAHILSFQIGYSCLSEGVTDLPKGTCGDIVEVHPFDHLLAASGSTEILEPIIDVDWYINSSNSIEIIRAIRETKNTAVFHGWVRYQHVFSGNDVIEEPFCYSYSPQNMRLNRVVRPKAKQTNESQKVYRPN